MRPRDYQLPPAIAQKSSKLGRPSIKWKPMFPPRPSIFARFCTTKHKTNVDIARALAAPLLWLKFLLRPMSPTTSPACPRYTHCKIHTRWSGVPWSTRALHNAGQWSTHGFLITASVLVLTSSSWPKPMLMFPAVFLLAMVPGFKVKNMQMFCIINEWMVARWHCGTWSEIGRL